VSRTTHARFCFLHKVNKTRFLTVWQQFSRNQHNNNNNNNINNNVLWSQQVQTDGIIPNKKTDITIRNDEKGTCMLIDVAISGTEM